MYDVGKYFRRRYNDLIGEKYSPLKVYVHSGDSERALMSAQAALAGLFPPTEDEKWNQNLMWHPIPVRMVPDELDILIYGGRECPKYWELYDYYLEESPEALGTMAKYKDIIANWSEMDEQNLTTIEDVTDLYKRLLSMNEKNEPSVYRFERKKSFI